jgi:outer membrane receptor protein involved in Fe transport
LTAFGTLSYVAGQDQTRQQPTLPIAEYSPQEPLPGIVPLESRAGLRLHDPCETPRWSVELSALMVAEQDLVAASLLEQPTPGYIVYNVRTYWQATDNLMLVAGVENLTNEQYRKHLDLRTGLGVFQPGRSLYFGSDLRY